MFNMLGDSYAQGTENFCDISRVQKVSTKEFRVPASWNKEGTGHGDSKQNLFRKGQLEHLSDPKVQNVGDSTSHFLDCLIHFYNVCVLSMFHLCHVVLHTTSCTTCLTSILSPPRGVCSNIAMS